MEFKDILKELRTSKGLTQKELADNTGLSMSIINKWENGKKMPSVQALIVLSKFFEETTDYLLGLDS